MDPRQYYKPAIISFLPDLFLGTNILVQKNMASATISEEPYATNNDHPS